MPGTVLIPLLRLASAELDVVIVLLLSLALSCFVVGFATGAGTENYKEDEHKAAILFHDALFSGVNTTSPAKRTAFRL